MDQDGDGKVSTQEAEDFADLTAGLKASIEPVSSLLLTRNKISLHNYSPAAVQEWLIEMGLSHYFSAFTDVGLYTLDDLKHAELTEDSLEEDMGVASHRERTKIMKALARFEVS